MKQRDFVETSQGLFSVLSPEPIAGYLRYRRVYGKLEKVSGDISLINKKDVLKVYSASDRLIEILHFRSDGFEDKIFRLIEFLSSGVDLKNFGVTGSVLLKCYNDDSDIDIVIYGEDNFNAVRELVKDSVLCGGAVEALSVFQLRELYKKRIFSSELSFAEFMWHEKRKYNKGSINGTKFDILLSDNTKINLNFTKTGKIKISGTVIEAKPFSFPAYYVIESNAEKAEKQKHKILCFTHTYIGQAFEGDRIEVSGSVDLIEDEKYVVVGTSREATGEYIKAV